MDIFYILFGGAVTVCAKTLKAILKCCLGQDTAMPLLRKRLSCLHQSIACMEILSCITIMQSAQCRFMSKLDLTTPKMSACAAN